MRPAFTSLLAFAAVVYAVGDAVVKNESDGTIYLWSVGDAASEQVTIQPGSFTLPATVKPCFTLPHIDMIQVAFGPKNSTAAPSILALPSRSLRKKVASIPVLLLRSWDIRSTPHACGIVSMQ